MLPRIHILDMDGNITFCYLPKLGALTYVNVEFKTNELPEVLFKHIRNVPHMTSGHGFYFIVVIDFAGEHDLL